MIPTLARRRFAVALLTAAALLGAGCGGDDTTAESGPYVVATTGIWADIVRDVACDGGFDVRTLVPAGASSCSSMG